MKMATCYWNNLTLLLSNYPYFYLPDGLSAAYLTPYLHSHLPAHLRPGEPDAQVPVYSSYCTRTPL